MLRCYACTWWRPYGARCETHGDHGDAMIRAGVRAHEDAWYAAFDVTRDGHDPGDEHPRVW